jgi:uncharacterized protein
MADITTIAALDQIYNAPPKLASTAKEIGWLTPDYRKLVEASPFAVLATAGPEGLDCSPRGDQPGFVRIASDNTLIMPDRRGNNRIDSLRNIVRDPRVALLFLIPGLGTTFRVNGTAVISADPDLLSSFAVAGQAPRTAIIITITACYFQCARAIVRSKLWDAGSHVAEGTLPTPGNVLEDLTKGEINAKAYDTEWPVRAAKTLW